MRKGFAMDYNLANGGLLMRTAGRFFLSDVGNYSGTNIIDVPTGHSTTAEGIFWFMNCGDRHIYYSDQKYRNALCRFDTDMQREEVLVDKPCYGLLIYREWLYYINENDGRLYRCTFSGKNEQQLSEERLMCFMIENDEIYYSSQQGIKLCSTDGGPKEALCGIAAAGMVLLGDHLAFVNKKDRHTLAIFNMKTGSTETFEDICPVGLNTDGKYLYCSNRKNGKSIYRIDPAQGRSIRICGEPADYLHIIENEICFFSRREWYRMPLLGGQAVKMTD